MIRLLDGIAWCGICTMMIGAGIMLEQQMQEHSRMRLNAHLEQCGYRPHKLADVAWEMTRAGDVPACTSAAISAQFRSPQSAELTSCMEQFYPVPVCNRP